MNRLVLVGNGFDLAHGLKTSYCHFISDYLCKVMTSVLRIGRYADTFLEIVFNGDYYYPPVFNVPEITTENALEYFESLEGNPDFTRIIKSILLSETLHKIQNFNWVDLENEYFDHLLKCKGNEEFDYDQVKKLNEDFESMRTLLEDYLDRHQQEFSRSFGYIDYCSQIFFEKIKASDLAIADFEDEIPKSLHILSFNYTFTLDQNRAECLSIIPTELNYIHGEIKSPTNPIIFGFGDEYDKNYLGFEELKNKDLLRHIKSFSYVKTSNYHNLLRFIESDDFQVYIFGHSCGLSDRTMLKHIFEHDKCKSIKIFYHKRNEEENDFTDKTYDISRHFSDKGSMRKKLVPFEKSIPLPQARIVPR